MSCHMMKQWKTKNALSVEPRMLRKSYRHYAMCGDSTSEDDVAKLMGGEKADMVFTSPPYGVSVDSLRGGFKKQKKLYNEYEDTPKETKEVNKKALSIALGVSDVVFWNIQYGTGNKEWFFDVLLLNKLVDIFIWSKTNPPPGSFDNIATSGFEFIFLFSNTIKGRKVPRGSFKGHELSTVYTSAVTRMNNGHKASFSLEMVNHFLSKIDGETVYEPFLGSGSTLIACEKTNRKCYGMEIDVKYMNTILKRFEEYSGDTVELAC